LVTSGRAVRLESVNRATPSASPPHDRIEALLAIAIDLPLEPDEVSEVARHLASCAGCRTTALAYGRDASALRDVVLVAPPDRVQAAVLAAAARPPPSDAASGRTRRVGVRVVVVAAAVIGGLVVVMEQLLR
jgi:anti-sigma factor RsiW